MNQEPRTKPTLAEVANLASSIFLQKNTLDAAKNIVKNAQEKLDDLENKMIYMLKDAGLESFKSSMGTCTISNRTSVRIPQTVEDKLKLFEYLKQKNIFNELVGVNAQTLNSFYKSELEKAIERGDDEWKLPGVGEPVITETLYVRKS